VRLSRRGLDLIKSFEGLRLVAYLCPAKVPTIGYGTTAGVTLKDVLDKRAITEAEAEAMLVHSVEFFEACIRKNVTITLNQNQFDALVSLVYNIGCGNLKTSRALKLTNERHFWEAGDAILLWDKIRDSAGRLVSSAGLFRRRKAERALFLERPVAPPLAAA